MSGTLLACATQYQVDLAKYHFTVTLSGQWRGLSILSICSLACRVMFVQKTFNQLGGEHRVYPVYECVQCDCWTRDCKVNVENDALFHTGVYFNLIVYF